MSDIFGFMRESFFLNNQKSLRKEYNELNYGQRLICKTMLYANPFLTVHKKDAVWEYVNRDLTYRNLMEIISK